MMRILSRGRGTAPSRLGAVVGTLAAVAALAGCVSIPTSGPIGTGEGLEVEPGVAILLPEGPEFGASPEDIVYGFLQAGGAGVYDNFAKAREFLTDEAYTEWDPRAHKTIYTGGVPTVEPQDDGTVLVTVQALATVDAAGQFTESPPAVEIQLVFRLAQDPADQWRISALDDGVLMSLTSFEDAYRSVRVYFATPDREQLVAESRWCVTSDLVPCAAVAVIDGPSPWLRDGLVTGAPDGARLTQAGVSVSEEGVATLELSSGSAGASGDRNLLQAQLEATLRLAGITDVKVTRLELPWEPSAVPELARDVSPDAGPFVIAGDRLAVIEGREVVPVEDAAPLTGLVANSPAVSLDPVIRVLLDGTQRLTLLPEGSGEPRVLFTGENLVAPSIDRFGWVWTAEHRPSGKLTAVRADGETVDVTADWLDGRQVRSMRVSRDGSRVAIVSAGPELRSTVEVASVIRDDDDRPLRLSEDRLTVGASIEDVFEVAWMDEVTLAVLGSNGVAGDPTAYRVPLGGRSEALPFQPGADGIAAAKGRLYLVGDDERLWRQEGASWAQVAVDVRDPVFPG